MNVIIHSVIVNDIICEAEISNLVCYSMLGNTGIPGSYRDVETIDSQYANNLLWLLDNEIDTLDLGFTFSVEADAFGTIEVIKLKEGLSGITVTDDNKVPCYNRTYYVAWLCSLVPFVGVCILNSKHTTQVTHTLNTQTQSMNMCSWWQRREWHRQLVRRYEVSWMASTKSPLNPSSPHLSDEYELVR